MQSVAEAMGCDSDHSGQGAFSWIRRNADHLAQVVLALFRELRETVPFLRVSRGTPEERHPRGHGIPSEHGDSEADNQKGRHHDHNHRDPTSQQAKSRHE